jgi:hypothetical protein
MTVFAFAEAKNRGITVDSAAYSETVAWTKERLTGLSNPRDTRPGFSMVSTPALYLGLMASGLPEQDALSADDLRQIGAHLRNHQESDGSWSWATAPAQNRPPPVFESDEVATLLGWLALRLTKANQGGPGELQPLRDRAAAWLAKEHPNHSTQSTALRLLYAIRDGKKGKEAKELISAFFRLQNKDGGWSQVSGLPSDGYATGEALYVLSFAGVKPDRAEIKRAVEFLVSSQKEDGSWPMTPRCHPGAKPMSNPTPIVHSGTAWATIGLLRVLPQ